MNAAETPLGSCRRLSWRRPAMLATAISVPVTVAAALVFAHATPSTNVSRAAPGSYVDCERLMSRLPRTLDGQPRDHEAARGQFVVAWGRPPIVLRCGVGRPAQLRPYSSALLIGSGNDLSVNWLPADDGGAATSWTTVDRKVYIAVTVPSSYATPPLNDLSDVISRTLPAICTVAMTAGQEQTDREPLCTRRG